MRQVIIISGGSDGLGKAAAQKFSSPNQVVILAPNPEKTAAVASEIGCDHVVCDVTKWDQVKSAVDQIVDKYHQIDVLINNAGVWIEGPLDQNEPEQIHKAIEVNYLGTTLLSKAVIPQMKSQKSGLIINVISQAGFNFKENRSIYNSTKWAVTGFTKCLQKELSPFGIKVTGFYPGFMNTNLFEKIGVTKDKTKAMDLTDPVKALEFIISQSGTTFIPELGLSDTRY